MPAITEIPLTFQQALSAYNSGQLAQAENLLRQFLVEQPNHPDGLHMLGLVALGVGRHADAESLISQAITLAPQVAEYRSNLGLVLAAMRRIDEAITVYQEAIAIKPNYAEGYNNLGNALMARGQMLEAAEAFRTALIHRPDYVEALNNLGSNYQHQDLLDQSIACYEKALALKPSFAESHNNLANTFKKMGLLEEAVASYQRALQLRPNNGSIWNNLGNTLADGGQIGEARGAYDRACAAEPKRAMFHTSRLFALHLVPDYPPEEIFQEHLLWNQRHAASLSANIADYPNNPDPNRKIRIGYVSPDFREHSVASFVENLLANHNHEAVEIFCYPSMRKSDATSARFQSYSDGWRNIASLSDQQAADFIRQDQIDILVDLAAHTSGSRLLIFARKPAPIQITYLGYPDTTGLSTMDYRLTDAFADPPGTTEQFHTENLLRLPECFLSFTPPADAPDVAPLPALTKGHVTFGCFNVLAKINPLLVEWWCQILQGVPNSRILLKTRGLADAASRFRLWELFKAGGITEERVELRSWTKTRQEHLQMYGEMDIALDTFPYNGTTITCEALWMGVPVITLAGRTHVSRVGASILSNAKLSKLITKSPEEYIALAIQVAGKLTSLSKTRAGLRKKLSDSALTDGKRFAAQVEALYRQVWEKWCQERR